MKKTSISLAVTAAIALAGASFAAPSFATGVTNPYAPSAPVQESVESAPIVTFDHHAHWRMGAELVGTSLSFDGMTAGGPALGITLGADLPVADLDYIRLDARAATLRGSIDAADNENVDVRGTNYDLEGSYQHQFDESLWYARAGVGLEYRTLRATSDLGDLSHRALWANVNVERDFSLSETWRVTPQVKLGYLVQGRTSAGGISARQNSGYAGEFALAFTHAMGKKDVTIAPYYRYEHIAESGKDQGARLSASNGREAGVRVAFTF